MGLTLITPPAGYPVSLDEAKAQCRVEDDASDGLINSLIAAATEHVEIYTGRAIITQTWKLTLDAFTDSIMLAKGTVASVTYVKYYDVDGVEQTVSADDYTVDISSDPQWIVVNSDASWPSTLDGINAVNITFVAGYSTIPPSFKHAILLLIGQWYDNRSDVTERQMISMPNAVEALLRGYRNLLV